MTDDGDETTNREIFLDAVRAVAGDRGVGRILDARGGSEVKIPVYPTRDNWIAEVLGYANALRICTLLRVNDADGRSISYPKFTLPLGVKSKIKSLIAQVDASLLEGQKVSYTALVVGVHERTVWRRKAVLIAQGKLARPSKYAPETSEPSDG